MAFGSMKCNAICLFGGLDSGSILSVMQYHVIRYCPIHRWYRSSPTLIALPPSLHITVTLCYRYDTELIKVSNHQRSHQLNPRVSLFHLRLRYTSMNQTPRLLVGENQIRKTSHTKTRKARNKKEEKKGGRREIEQTQLRLLLKICNRLPKLAA